MKKIFAVMMFVVVFAFSASLVVAQSFGTGFTQGTTPRYECGYYYQTGLRTTDCFQDGQYVAANNQMFANPTIQTASVANQWADDDVMTPYEGYQQDLTARTENPAMMADPCIEFGEDSDECMMSYASSFYASGEDSDSNALAIDGKVVEAEDETIEIYGDPNGVHLSTIVEYWHRIGNYNAQVYIPSIHGMADSELEKSLNEYIRSVGFSVIDQFEDDARAILADYPEDGPHFMVNYDYYLQTDSEWVLTVALEYFSAAASSNVATQYLNFNKDTRELIKMDYLFEPGSIGATLIREEIERQMRAQIAAGAGQYWIDDTDPAAITLNWDELMASIIANYQYYINEDGAVVVAFNKYDVAPGSMGTPQFVIPQEVIDRIDDTQTW